jgi:hypothetical protein
MGTNFTTEDVMAALQLVMDAKAAAPAATPAATPTRDKRKGRELSEEQKAKMAEGRRRAAEARKATNGTPAAKPAPVPAPVTPQGERPTVTLTSPHGDLKFTAEVSKAGKPYILMHVHDGYGGQMPLYNLDHMQRLFWPVRTCETDQLVALQDFFEAHGRKPE